MASGAATGLDRWAAEHATPLAGTPGLPPTPLESLVPLLHAPFHPLGVAVAELVTLPGQVVVSLLLVVAASGALWRRRRRAAAVAWPAAWAAATAVEVVFRTHADAAAALAAAWPRLRLLLAIWLAAAVVLLELAGFHAPTDIAGGLLLAAVAAAAAVGVERSGFLGRRAALRRARPGA